MKKSIFFAIALLITSSIAFSNGMVNVYGKKNNNQEYTSLQQIITTHDKVIIDFWAEWCGPCRNMMPALEKIAKKNPDVYIVKVNIDDYRALSEEYGIRSLPTLLFFKNTKRVAVEIGSKTLNELTSRVKRYFG